MPANAGIKLRPSHYKFLARVASNSSRRTLI
jgi:hypothetical protein